VLGDQIKALREAKCWSQAHLADAARVNVRTIQRIEAGEPCSFETMMSIAAALGVELSALDQRAILPKNKRSSLVRRQALATICLAPAMLFIGLNLLRSIAGVTQPYDAAAAAGGKIMSFHTFNMMSPAVFLGGAAAALIATLPTLLRLRGKKEGSTRSITAVEIKAEWTSLTLALAALCTMATLVAYAALEWLFTALH
jgi:transcriptional regulator with XRE-family HTH domain